MGDYRDILLVLLAIPVGALTLRMACRQAMIQEPTFPRALAIAFLVLLIGVPVGAGLRLAADHLFGPNPPILHGVLRVGLSLLLGMLISAGVYRAMIPQVTFLDGVIIWVWQALILIALMVPLVIAAVVVLRIVV